jgi:SAM-dependent methyltransferase
MDVAVKNKLIQSYQVDGGFIVHDIAMLKRIYHALNIEPKTSFDARIYELEGLTHFFQHAVASLARKININRNDCVLSPGEGSGAPSRLLARMFGCKVTGIDVNPDQIKKANELALFHGVEDNVKYFEQDVAELSLPKKDFNKAFINETCGHWQDKEKAFKRISVHLKPGALAGLNIWLKGDKGSLNEAYAAVPEFRPLYKEGIWFQDDLETYLLMLKRSGFEVLEKYDCTDKIDAKIRARLKAVRQWELYEQSMGGQARESGINYYLGMLKTHYDFLKYGVIVARKK